MKTRLKSSLFLCFLISMVLPQAGRCFYNPSEGRWLSRDPIGERGCPNLYGLVGNATTDVTDPLGLDFIAIADRPVEGTLHAFRHYSIQYWWRCDADAPFAEADIDEWLATHKISQKVKSVQLLADGGWKVWGKKPGDGFWSLLEPYVSVIHFNDTAVHFVAAYVDSPLAVKDKWRTIESLAKAYQYAEQDGFNGKFQHWPNSKYGFPWDLPFNNSNTFVRDTIRNAGLVMKELAGAHPGNDSLQPVPDIYHGFPTKGDPGPSPDY